MPGVQISLPTTNANIDAIPNFPASAAAITKSDDNWYDPPINVYVGTAGDVAIIPAVGNKTTAVTYKNVPAGATVPCRAYKVMSTNTTAADLVGSA